MDNSYLGNFQMLGISSGIDTASMIDALMKAERIPLDRAEEKYNNLALQQKSWMKVDDKLEAFWDEALKMRLQSNLNPKTATSSDESAISATLSGADNQTFYAKATQLASSSYIDGNTVAGTTSESTLADLGLTNGNTVTVDVNGEAYTVNIDTDQTLTEDSTYQDLINNINRNSEANIVFSKQADDSLKTFLLNDERGDKTLEISSTSSDFLGNVFNNGTAVASLTATTDGYKGTNAQFEIDLNGDGTTDLNLDSETDTVKFNGVNLTANSVSTDFSKISVINDTAAAVENIQGFVDKYNETMEFLYDKLHEDKVAGKDEADMTEEEKMQGMLKGDRNLERIFFQMRSIAYKTLDWDTTNSGDTMPEYTSLSQVGISSGDTGANYDNTMKGLLSINETELKNALENNFDDVYKLFSHSNSFEVAGETKYNKGIITQMKDYSFDVTKFGGYIDNVAGTSGTIGNQMMDLAKRMTNMIDQLQRKEFRYVQQFSAMEEAISRMQSQGSYLMSRLG
jgi:flagellar hook-associated protein 2